MDTDGNQLPYIDKIQLNLAENLEVVNLRAIAGEYDYQARHMDIGKLPVFIENQQKGNYKVSINPMLTGSDYGIFINMDYDADPEIGKWLKNVDFRQALSLGDRPRPDQRDVLPRRRHAGSRRAGRVEQVQPRPGVAAEVVHARSQAGERAAGQGRAGPRRTPRATVCGPTARAGSASI